MDVPAWDPEAEKSKPGYLYERLAGHIAALIAAGRYPVDSMLPNEREMVAEFGVSIDTVRRAVAELRDRGLVVTYPSKGSYVAGRPESAGLGAAPGHTRAYPELHRDGRVRPHSVPRHER